MAYRFERYTEHWSAKGSAHRVGSAERCSQGGSPTDIHLLMEIIIPIVQTCYEDKM